MITEQQFFNASKIIGCSISAIRAVYDVEAAGRGYLTDGRVKILFEGHRFWKRLSKVGGVTDIVLQQQAKLHPNVLYKNWDKKQYKGGAAEWDRMSEAIALCSELNVNPIIALDSASYGSFQIMGENALLCGYANSQEMLAAYNSKGEAEQLDSFCRFVKATGLDDELRAKNWAAFAKGYNGTSYRENSYDKKLAAADKKYS
jgi:hypothetical protein